MKLPLFFPISILTEEKISEKDIQAIKCGGVDF
jgi:hypothetical protein